MAQEINWDKIKQELISTQRDGVLNLIKFLESSDFQSAPASSKYHLNVLGGLMQHSLNVLDFARKVNKETGANVADESLILSSLLHDLCKVNYYIEGEEWDKEHKDKTNEWRKKKVWKIEDQLPMGHGEKSAMLAVKYLDLHDDEVLAIRWHMLKWDCGPSSEKTMQDAMNKYPLVKVVAIADQLAELYETVAPQGQGTLL